MSVDLLTIFSRYHVDIDLTVNRGWANVRCPWCSDRGHHGGFNLAGSYYNCWKCGSHDLGQTLKRLLRLSFAQVAELLKEFEGHSKVVERLNSGFSKVTKLDWPGKPLIAGERKYLKSRGFDPKYLVSVYGIAGGGISGDWKYRILIPLFLDGRLVSYLGRDITGQSKMRYKNLALDKSILDPKDCLYNIDACKSDEVFILEGPTDVWRMGPGFVATLGTSVTSAQVKLIAQRFKRATFLFDPEPEAQAKAARTATQLAALGVATDLVDLELDDDPGSLSFEQANDVRKELGLAPIRS